MIKKWKPFNENLENEQLEDILNIARDEGYYIKVHNPADFNNIKIIIHISNGTKEISKEEELLDIEKFIPIMKDISDRIVQLFTHVEFKASAIIARTNQTEQIDIRSVESMRNYRAIRSFSMFIYDQPQNRDYGRDQYGEASSIVDSMFR